MSDLRVESTSYFSLRACVILFGGQRIACSRLSVSEDDRKSERATSGISCERDPGVKRRGRESL